MYCCSTALTRPLPDFDPPQKVNDIIVYGGEYCELDSGRVHVYGDLFRFNTDKKKWSKVTCPHRWGQGQGWCATSC
jgi:hypothetical protein